MPDNAADPVREYRFGACRINLPSREILRDAAVVPTEPKAYDLLVYLIAHRDRAVGKDELQDAIWPGVIVTEGALTRCIMKARRAIDDSAAIATVRGHGYRFVRDVEEIGPAEERAAPTSDKPAVVVLPFVNIGDDAAQEYFSDGITDDVITELSRFRSLFVIARPSAFRYKGRSIGARQIAAELGVEYVVDGSLQRAGDRLRMNVRLIDARADAQIWAERYDREIEDVLVVQEELAATVAATIGGRVEVTRGRRRLERSEVESYDRLLRAQSLYYDFRKDANAEARALLEQALELDPHNARALAILAAVHSMDSWTYWADDPAEAQRLSLDYGRRSLELDDSDSLAQALYAEILHDCGDPQRSEHHFRRAIAINPNDIAARALYASKLAARGRIDEALEQLTIAERLDPFGLVWIPVIKGSVMYAAGRDEEAIAAIRTMEHPPAESLLVEVAALGRLGRKDEAAVALQRLLESAEREMPNYPGPALTAWREIISRMRGDPSDDTLDEFLESLRLAGWH